MVTAQLVKELRERTGVGMSDCKNALVESNGDMEMAIELLRKKGLAKAAKRAGNDTTEGKIKISIDGTTAYIAVVSCETDFVSRSEAYEEMLTRFIDIRKSSTTDEEAISQAEELKASEYTLKVGENLVIRTLTKVEGAVLSAYVHSNFKQGALVVGNESADGDTLKQVAMHIVAASPEFLSPSDVDQGVLAKEKEIALAQMQDDPKNTGKPQEILEKIIDGKMKKFAEENALLTQQFVINPDVRVQDIAGNTIVAFYKFAI